MRTLATMTLTALAALPFCSCWCMNCDKPNMDYTRDLKPDTTQNFDSEYLPLYMY